MQKVSLLTLAPAILTKNVLYKTLYFGLKNTDYETVYLILNFNNIFSYVSTPVEDINYWNLKNFALTYQCDKKKLKSFFNFFFYFLKKKVRSKFFIKHLFKSNFVIQQRSYFQPQVQKIFNSLDLKWLRFSKKRLLKKKKALFFSFFVRFYLKFKLLVKYLLVYFFRFNFFSRKDFIFPLCKNYFTEHYFINKLIFTSLKLEINTSFSFSMEPIYLKLFLLRYINNR